MDEEMEYSCVECGQVFMVPWGVRADLYCSDPCRGITHSEANIDQLSKVLRKREAWRYVRISQFLNRKNVAYQFEYPLGPFIFDTALIDAKIFIEFDEPYHDRAAQRVKDLEKERYAEKHGWKLFRCPAKSNSAFPVLFVEDLCDRYIDQEKRIYYSGCDQTMYGKMYKKK